MRAPAGITARACLSAWLAACVPHVTVRACAHYRVTVHRACLPAHASDVWLLVCRSPGRQTTFDVEDTSPPSTASDAGALDLLERGGIAAVANADVDDQASLLIMDDDAPSISALKDVLRLITVSHTLGSSGTRRPPWYRMAPPAIMAPPVEPYISQY